jgi:hypothetical protein
MGAVDVANDLLRIPLVTEARKGALDEAEAVERERCNGEAAHAEPASSDAGTSGEERIGLKSTVG